VLNSEVVITTNEQSGECRKITTNKETKTEEPEMTIKLLGKYLVWTLEKDEMNSDGPYVCNQYSKLRPEVKKV